MQAQKSTLTESQHKQYEVFGFLVLRSVLSRDELEVIGAEFERGLDAAHSHNPDVGSSRQLQWSNLSGAFPTIAALLEDSRICGVAEQLLGESATPTFSNANRWVTDTGWHRDTPHTNLRGVKIACYLQPVDGESGALRFVPGSHEPSLNGEVDAFLSKTLPDLRDVPAHICESEPGDVIAFDNRLYHAAVGSSADKRQLTMNFVERPVTPEGKVELADLGNLLRAQYARLNAPTPLFGDEWVANPEGNSRRQRIIDLLRSVGML